MSPLTGKDTAVGVAHQLQSVRGSQHSHPQLRGHKAATAGWSLTWLSTAHRRESGKLHTQGELKVHK